MARRRICVLTFDNTEILKGDDEVTAPQRHSERMPVGEMLRVGVDVTPRLFSDALIRVLEHHDVEVVSILSVGMEGLDVVVTSPGGRDRIPSDVLVVEVRPGAASSVVEEPPAVSPSDTIHDLEDLIAVIRRFAGPGQDVSTV